MALQMACTQRYDVFVDGGRMEDDLSTIASDCYSKASQQTSIIINMPAVNDRLPAALREELRRCISLKGLDLSHKKSSMKVCEQRQFMHGCFHGQQQQERMHVTKTMMKIRAVMTFAIAQAVLAKEDASRRSADSATADQAI